MIVSIDLSQEIFSIDMLRVLKSSLKHRRKHVLRSLQLYGDQALRGFQSCQHIDCKYFSWNVNTCDHYSHVNTTAYVESLKNVFATMCLRSLRRIWRPGFTCVAMALLVKVADRLQHVTYRLCNLSHNFSRLSTIVQSRARFYFLQRLHGICFASCSL